MLFYNIKFHLKLQRFNMHLPQLIMMDGSNQMIQLYFIRKIAGAQCLHEGAMIFRSRHFLRFGYVTLFWILLYLVYYSTKSLCLSFRILRHIII